MYKSIIVLREGFFPDVPPTFSNGAEVNGDAGKLVYLRFSVNAAAIPLKAGVKYAFMVGLQKKGDETGFTLGNVNTAGLLDPPALADRHDSYPPGWSIRREGNGTVPPAMTPGEKAPADQAVRQLHLKESLFGRGSKRFSLSPTADGYPDVDTYRGPQFCPGSKLEIRLPIPALSSADKAPY